jgi:hypothetical protein
MKRMRSWFISNINQTINGRIETYDMGEPISRFKDVPSKLSRQMFARLSSKVHVKYLLF